MLGEAKILDVNPLTGETVTFRYDHATDKIVLGHHQDLTAVEAILDDNRMAQLDTDMHKRGAKKEWSLYARVPNIVQMEWLHKHGVDMGNKDHWSACMKLINSPDYKYLKRTSYYHDR
jgi:hypothetical protein